MTDGAQTPCPPDSDLPPGDPAAAPLPTFAALAGFEAAGGKVRF